MARIPSTLSGAVVLVLVGVICGASAFAPSLPARPSLRAAASRRAPALSLQCKGDTNTTPQKISMALSSFLLSALLLVPAVAPTMPAFADNKQEDFKIQRGAASTQDSGSRRTITRGAVMDGGNYEGKNLKGISFQQSLCRDCNFKGSKLVGASFFDGDLTQANFEDADVSQVNFEMACLKDANLKNAIVTEAYILATTKLEGVNIEGADFTNTFLRKDQQRYLCKRASGTNPKTGVATADSLNCGSLK